MSPITFFGWLVVALGTLVAAVVVAFDRPGTSSVVLANETAFPVLREAPDSVARLEVTAEGKTFVVERGPDGKWIAPKKSGYPVKPDLVRDLIVGLSDMRLVEAKTGREDRFHRLELEDPEGEGAQSRRVRLLDGEAAVLAETVVGKASGRYTGGAEGGTYIRRPDDQRAWLASGSLALQATLEDWLDSDILHLSSAEIRRLDLRPPEGQAIVLDRPERDGDFTLEALPEGRVLDASQSSRLASGLSFLTFDDVVRREQVVLPQERIRGEFTTYEGIQVTIQMAEIDKAFWAVLSARFLEDSEGALALDEDDASGARRRAEEIAARTEGWVYQIPVFAADRLKVEFDALHKDPESTS